MNIKELGIDIQKPGVGNYCSFDKACQFSALQDISCRKNRQLATNMYTEEF